MMLRVWGGPTALLCWAALVRERSRGRSLGVRTVKRVGRVEGGGWVVALQRAVDGVGISPGHHLHRSPQGFTEMGRITSSRIYTCLCYVMSCTCGLY